MPRAGYIYLVRTGDLISQGAVPVAAFTVKRKMRAWLLRQPDELRQELAVYRMRDGGGGTVTEMNMDDIMNGET